MIPLIRVEDPNHQRNFDLISKNLGLPVPQAKVVHSVDVNIANAAWTLETFNTESFDSGDLHSTSVNTGRLTAPIEGLYLLVAQVAFASNGTGIRGGRIPLNGTTTFLAEREGMATTGAFTQFTVTGLAQLVAGDYITLEVFQSSGGLLASKAPTANTTPGTYLSMVRLGGYTNFVV